MRSTEWIKKESEQWVQEGIITSTQKEQIQSRYPENKGQNPLLLFFAVIGSLLIGAGIILVFATNWWMLPVAVKIALAFLPLLAAQGICLFTALKRNYSVAFKEGAAIFLSLSFFAALALIGQVFHTPRDLTSYILVCSLFTLPGVYLFRSRAALAIYMAGVLFTGWSWSIWVSLLLNGLILPFFYWEFMQTDRKGPLDLLLFLLSSALANTIILCMRDNGSILETATACGLSLLLLDAVFKRLGRTYFFTLAKLFGILCITGTLLIAGLDFSYTDNYSVFGLACILTLAAAYIAVRYTDFSGMSTSDLFAAAALLLALLSPVAGITANLLLFSLGAFHIVQGSRWLALKHLNFGMALVVLILSIRFFDSSLDLLSRGIAFILLGAAFLCLNLFIARKRKEL